MSTPFPPPPPQIGPFRIVRTLGRGGMGVVYEGVEQTTGQRAAIKTILSHYASDPSIRKRFEAEIDALLRLNHPNIVRILGSGVTEVGDLFYAMEMIDGMDLEHAVPRGSSILWMPAVKLILEISAGLKAAHDRGIIHRDLKPANVLCTPEGRVLLTDFGIARIFGSENETLAGAVLGTAEYMSPEQARGDRLDLRTDLYAAGGILYRLIAGRPPLLGRSVTELLKKQREIAPDPLSTYAVALPPELDRLVNDLLEKDPAKRPHGAMALSRRLTEILTEYDQLEFPAFRPNTLRSDPNKAPDQDSGKKDQSPVMPPTVATGSLRDQVNAFSEIPKDASELGYTYRSGAAEDSKQTLTSEPEIYQFNLSGDGNDITLASSASSSSGSDQTIESVPGAPEIYGFADPTPPAATSPSFEDDGTRGFDLRDGITIESSPPKNRENTVNRANGANRVPTDAATQFCQAMSQPTEGAADATRLGGNPDILGNLPTASGRVSESGDRYQAVREEDRDHLRLVEDRETVPAWKLPQTWILLGVLLCFIGGLLWLFRPMSADRLAAQIDGITSEVTESGISLRAEEPIQLFLAKFPDDPRSESYREYQSEMDLFRLERHLEWRARAATRRGDPATALEHEYLRAVALAKLDPTLGATRFGALMTLYADYADSKDRDGQCYELVKRQYEKYTEQSKHQMDLERTEFERQWSQWEQLHHEDELAATERLAALREIYSDRPWALAAMELRIGMDAGGPSFKTEVVRGMVTYQGVPVEGAQVTFIENGKSLGQGMFGGATTDESGEYRLSASGGDAESGMPVGEYTVTIKKNVPIESFDPPSPEDSTKRMALGGRPKMKSVIPEKYGDPNHSGLTVSVKEGVNIFDFSL